MEKKTLNEQYSTAPQPEWLSQTSLVKQKQMLLKVYLIKLKKEFG